jgi:hypothetical protein
LIAQEEWESLMETAMIMQTPNILQQIEIARQEYLTGETVSMEQIFGSNPTELFSLNKPQKT